MKDVKYMIFGEMVIAILLLCTGCGGGNLSMPLDGVGGLIGGGGDGDNGGGGGVVIETGALDPDGGETSGETSDEASDDQTGEHADLDGDGIANDQDPDADGDGFEAADGDYNDLEPTIFPGAPDKPDYPDYTDSNCDGMDGDIDDAYWVSNDGNDANPGTIEEPFLTIKHGLEVAGADPDNVRDVYVVGGRYSEDNVILNGVGLYGGFGPLDGNGLRPRKIGTFVTEYTGAMVPLVIAGPSPNGLESVIEGMTINGPTDNAAMVIANSSPTVRYNMIHGVQGPHFSGAVNVFAGAPPNGVVSNPFFLGNIIDSADCSLPDGQSIALSAVAMGMDASVKLTLKENTIRSGLANRASVGVYVAAGMLGKAVLTAQKNDIEAGSGGALTSGIMVGRDVNEQMALKIDSVDIYKNRIHGGHFAAVSYGIMIFNTTDAAQVTNNFITGGEGDVMQATGVAVSNSEVSIRHNTINAGTSLGLAEAIGLEQQASAKIDNNILCVSDALIRYGINEKMATTTPATLTNNLFDWSADRPYHDFTLGNLMDIDKVNSQSDIAVIGDNISGSAAFIDREGYDYHLSMNSDAIDAGDMDDVANDIDDDARPYGGLPDIGADELTDENAQWEVIEED